MFSNAYSGITFAIFEFMRNLNKLPIRVGTDFEFKVLLFNTIDIRVVGLILLTFVIITVMATDIGAYNFGMLFSTIPEMLCRVIQDLMEGHRFSRMEVRLMKNNSCKPCHPGCRL